MQLTGLYDSLYRGHIAAPMFPAREINTNQLASRRYSTLDRRSSYCEASPALGDIPLE